MADKNLTVYQRLTRILGPDGPNTKTQVQKFNIGKNELLKTDNKQEYETQKLQAQQTKYLGQVWKKVENGMFQQSINYETTRISSYSDFEAMEFYPEIAAALDIMSEESTTLNNNGKMVNVYSDSKRVKGIVEDLLENRLDIHTSLPMWTRNTVKYGDNFVFLKIDDKNGIVKAKQMPNFEMERHETDLLHFVTSTETDNSSNNVKFLYRTGNVEFNSWQMAHFRLLGDDRKLPYGTSVLEKARRIWKQLLLSEDSMLVYRVTRAPERRVYKIYVGNINDEDVEAYVNEIANRFKRMPITDPQTGQMDLRFNQLSNDQDYFIPVRSEDAPNPIDTLPGASNLDQIADIEYLQKKLFTALRVPKPFLGFEEATGDGKNLALQDIRFTRTINRIQQTMLQELNKIVIIHLILLGFDEDLDNFTLTMNNPSTQAKMLEVENKQKEITLYKDSVSDAGNGFAPMSMTRAHREILGWSDDEIKQDLLEQRMEKAAAAELANSSNVIKHTGMFDIVDRIYGDYQLALKGGGTPEGEGGGEEGGSGGGSGGLGGSFGGGGLGGDDLDFSEGGEDAEGTDDGLGGEVGGDEAGAEGTEDAATDEAPAEENPLQEGIKKVENLLKEEKIILNKQLNERLHKYQNVFVNRLIESIKPDKKNLVKKTKIYDKSLRINDDINNMIENIDDMLNEKRIIN